MKPKSVDAPRRSFVVGDSMTVAHLERGLTTGHLQQALGGSAGSGAASGKPSSSGSTQSSAPAPGQASKK